MSEVGVCADGRLGEELSGVFEPKLQDALNHPVRREILRVLHAREQACGLAEVLGGLRSGAQSEVRYHLQVLQAAGAVVSDGTRPAPGGRDSLYRSALADSSAALAALGATELADRRRRHAAEGGSSGLLKMFRVPRPERSVRLRMGRDRKSQQGE